MQRFQIKTPMEEEGEPASCAAFAFHTRKAPEGFPATKARHCEGKKAAGTSLQHPTVLTCNSTNFWGYHPLSLGLKKQIINQRPLTAGMDDPLNGLAQLSVFKQTKNASNTQNGYKGKRRRNSESKVRGNFYPSPFPAQKRGLPGSDEVQGLLQQH